MAYKCTLNGCVIDASGIYATEELCEAACVGWGCQDNTELPPNTDVTFVFDMSGSLPTPTVEEYFKATTAWTQTLTDNGWVGDANWVGSKDLGHDTNTCGAYQCPESFSFTDSSGTVQGPIDIHYESWLQWGSLPYIATNTDANGNKDFMTGTNSWNLAITNGTSCVGWCKPPGPTTNDVGGCPNYIFCNNTLYSNYVYTPPWSPTYEGQISLSGLENYFTKYTLRENIALTGFTYPPNDQLVVIITSSNYGYGMGNASSPGAAATVDPTFKLDYDMWDTIYDNQPANVKYKAFVVPATYHEPVLPTENYGGSGVHQLTENDTQRGMLLSIYNGNQDNVSIGGTGTKDGTWVVIADQQLMPNGSTCNNPLGCSTAPGGEASDNPCIYNGNFGPYNSGALFNPCYTHSMTNAGVLTLDWHADTNPYWPGGVPTWGGLEDKGWSSRAWDNTLNNPQNDLINLLNITIDATVYQPTLCMSAETLWNDASQVDYPYFLEMDCTGNTANGYVGCIPTTNYSCTTSGCVETTAQTGTNLYPTSGECKESCVGWGCSVTEDLSTDIFVWYDHSSMGVGNRQDAHDGVEAYLATLNFIGNVYHCVGSPGEEWLVWPVKSMNGGFFQYTDVVPVGGGTSFTLPVRDLTGNTLNIIFCDESTSQYYTGMINATGGGYGGFANLMADRTSYVNKWNSVDAAGGNLDCFLYPTTSQAGAAGATARFAEHVVAIIHPGNNTPLDGMWQAGSSPDQGGTAGAIPPNAELCGLFDLVRLESVNPYWDGNVPTRSLYNPVDGLSRGWSVNHEYPTLNAQTLANDITYYMDNNTGVQTQIVAICYSAETDYLLDQNGFSSATQNLCWIDCDIQGWSCEVNGCVGGYGAPGLYGTYEDCLTGTTQLPACTSYNCSPTGCTLHNELGTANYTGSGNLGSGGTHQTLNACLLTECASYDCSASGCTQFNISAGTLSYTTGSGGTGGTFSTSNCDGICTSFDCTSGGCVDYNVSVGTASYNLFVNSVYQGDGGSGGTYSYDIECSGVCVSYECTDYGCVLYNDPDESWAPGYVDGTFGTGGTFSGLAACTAACQSFGCETGGCEAWNDPSNTNSYSWINANALHDLGGNYGTGGTSALTACTAQCFTWECADDGCVSTPGGDPFNPYQWDDENICNQNCTSHNCLSTGCTVQAGSGGTYTGNQSLAGCQLDCNSWECDPLPGNNGGITLSTVYGYGGFTLWNQDPCTSYPGTGASFTFSSLADCQTGCTSWSCQYPGNYYVYPTTGMISYSVLNGCLQFGNTGNTYSTLTYAECLAQEVCVRYECTDNGCIVGDPVTGTYDSYDDCTGGTATLDACQSWNCTEFDGCELHNDPASPPSINGGYGTGGTNTTSLANCNVYCVSYSCTTTGCTEQAGYGSTYYDQYSPSNAAAMCQANCYSYFCTDDGCEVYNSILDNGSNSVSYINGLSGDGGTFILENNCDLECFSYNCTDYGCEYQTGTGGTFTTQALCTGSCQSFACATTGCTVWNNPTDTTAVSYIAGGSYGLAGMYGTGGTETQSGCTATCISYNCTDTGCVVTAGTQGMYVDLPTCNTDCSSWDCINSGCTEYNISAGTPSYTTGSGGTGGTYTSSTCDDLCSSWDCTNTGCTEYNVSAGTASYNLFVNSVYQGHGGTGGTYTSSTCDDFCYSYDCLEVEVPGWNNDWNQDGCVQQVGSGSTYYSGIGSLAGVVDSYTACTAQCRSWSCEYPSALTDGCLEFPNTGITNTFTSLVACTAETICKRYDCTDYGCVIGDHITGTYGGAFAYNDCEAACTSFTCTNTACLTWNDPNDGTFISDVNINPGGTQGGTGGTFTNDICDNLCTSYNCLSTYDFNSSGVNEPYNWDGCQQQTGSGGTYFNVLGDINSLADCNTGTTTLSACSSWSCENAVVFGANGCISYPNTGSTTQIMHSSLDVCTAQTICKRWDCQPEGCIEGSQVTGDFDSFDECTGGTAANNYADACQSWSCLSGVTIGFQTTQPLGYSLWSTGGCEIFNAPNSSGVTSTGALNYVPGVNYGTYGSGGENQTSVGDCNQTCKSWNCLDTGCTWQHGYGGAYDNDTCSTIGGVQNICQSYECDPWIWDWDLDSCSIYPGSGGTYFNTLGINFAEDDCQTGCTSWSCQNPAQTTNGCLQYPNTGNTLTQPTYTACTAETVCWRYDCTANGCVVGSQTGGTYDSYSDCINGTTALEACQSWQCNDDGCEEYNSPSYPASQYWIDSTYGTGGTNTISMVNCNLNCRSYECQDYGCEDYGGTGHTYPVTVAANEFSVWSTCVDNCKSWDCTTVQDPIFDVGCQVYNQLLVAPYTNWVTPNGNNGFGTGGTYTSTTSCSASCQSWTCEGMGGWGCTEFPNTGNTFSSYTSCTADTICKHYDCTVSGCIELPNEWNGGIDSYETMSACTENCVGWACHTDIIATGSSIYVYYDISNLTFQHVKNLRNKLQQYMNANYPTFAGNIYHTIVSDGRWLDWTNSIYSGQFSVPPTVGALPWEPSSFQDERALVAINETASVGPGQAGNWYDQYSAGTYNNIAITGQPTIASLTTNGVAPTANTSNNVIVINFITEADGPTFNATYPNVTSSGGYHKDSLWLGMYIPTMFNQPTQLWKSDYTSYLTNWTTVSANTGSIRALLFPMKLNPNQTGVIFNSESTQMCLLQSYAAISSGNQTIPDGTWVPGTAPRQSWQGGQVGGGGYPPELCSSELTQLEASNPYWTNTVPTWGGLDMSGWTVNIEGAQIGGTNFTGFLNDYLTTTTSGLTAGTCTSAETLYTANVAYIYSSDTQCGEECVPTMYLCTDTGCTLNWAGYLTLQSCTNKCKSVNCTNDPGVGCQWYNTPNSIPSNYVNGMWGTGGTFNKETVSGPAGNWTDYMLSCNTVCHSSTCYGYANNLPQQGCIAEIGTGGTFTGADSYATCTGVCRSWLCDDPCVVDVNNISTGVGCIEYPNTGATYTSSTACTAQCQENWYCLTGLTGSSSCAYQTDTGIITDDITDHIDIIGTTAAWNGSSFSSFKFILNNTVPYPTTGCYDLVGNGYWAKLNSIQVDIQIGGAPTTYYTFLNWTDLLATMNGTGGNTAVLVTPMTVIDDILNISGLTTTFNWEYCDCFTSSCSVGCENTSVLPSSSSGFYPTHLSASTTCCPTTWSCSANTLIDNCDSLPTLPGIHQNVEDCYEYMSINNMWYLDVTGFKCEISPTSVLPTCELGPNGGELVNLTGITSNIPAISSNIYTTWDSYISALQGLGTPVTSVYNGMLTTVIEALIWQVYPGTNTTYGWVDCECDNPYACACIEVSGPDGIYSSQTLCEETCCSATTWNCVQNQVFFPICLNKQYLGSRASELLVLDHYRANSPTSLFGLDKWTIYGGGWPSYTAAEVNANNSTSWQDCYEFIDIDYYLPYTYLYSVSHQLISGGTKYQTWYEFYNAVDSIVTACTPSDTVMVITNKINTHFSGVTVFSIETEFKSCCSKDPCYCYDTLTTGGDYASETLCDLSCCPPPPPNWDCRPTALGWNTCQYGNWNIPISNASINNVPGVGAWTSYTQCNQLDLKCATSWVCNAPSTTVPCGGYPCDEIAGHHQVTNAYPTLFSCETNTNIDCCGPEYLWKCMSSVTTTTLSGLTDIPDNFGTLGYHTSDDVLTYLADPTASPTRQYSGITAFTFCKYETGTTVLNAAEESCKCGDGCDGILHSSDNIVFNNLATGVSSNGIPYHPATNPLGYCSNWADMISQLNAVWAPTANVNLNNTFDEVFSAVTNTLMQVITISISGLESCVDITGPCFCDPCFTPNCGTSKDDCEDVCCVPTPTTWTCTSNGCLDVCNGEGEFSSKTECTLVCYEWGCMDDVWGCTDSGATNYNVLATIDDGTCVYPTNFWSCINSQSVDGCSGRTAIGGGLSFTAAIHTISGDITIPNSGYHTTEFSTLKYTLGGGNNQMQSPDDRSHQLPTQPCEVPCSPPSQTCVNGIATWGQPGPYYAYIKYVMYSGLPNVQYTTWASFIDAINLLGYTFTHYNSWQDLQSVLGRSQVHCEWTWCDCNDGCNCVPDANGPYTSELGCDSYSGNCCESWNCETTYVTNSCSGMTDIGFSTSVLWPDEPLEFMVNNGYQYTDVNTLKWIFNNPAPTGICTINNNTQHWAHYSNISVGSSVQPLGFTVVQNWDDAITWLNSNYNLGLSSTMSYQAVMDIIEQPGVGKYIHPDLGNCDCTGVDCACIEVFDGSGLYNSSGECSTNPTSCCTPPPPVTPSWDCDCTGATSGMTYSGSVTTSGASSTTELGVFFRWGAVVDHWATYIETNGDCSMWWAGSLNTPGYCLNVPFNIPVVIPPQNIVGGTGGERGWTGISGGGCPGSLPVGIEHGHSGPIPITNPLLTNPITIWINRVTTGYNVLPSFDATDGFNGLIAALNTLGPNNVYLYQAYGYSHPAFVAAGYAQQNWNTASCGGHGPRTVYSVESVTYDPITEAYELTVNWIEGYSSNQDVQHFFWSTTLINDTDTSAAATNLTTVGSYTSLLSGASGTCINKTLVPGGPQTQFHAVIWICDPVNVPYPSTLFEEYFYEASFSPPLSAQDLCEGPNGNHLVIPTYQTFTYCPNDSAFEAAYMPMTYTNKQDWVDQLVVAGLPATTNMDFFQLKQLILNTCGLTNQSGYGEYCFCTGSTYACDCVDPGDGSGYYSTSGQCFTDATAQCFTGTSQCSASTSCSVGVTYVPDNNFENFLETHSGATPTTAYGSSPIPATWPNTMGNGIIGDNLVLNNNICCVTHLSMSNQYISDLTGIESFNELLFLHCGHNQLTTIDVSNNINLRIIWTENNQLTALDISYNVDLTWVSCQNNQLTSLDTSNNPLMTQVLCYVNAITSLDFSQNPLMKYIWCWQNQLTSIDVSMLPDLRDLRCSYQPLGTIDVTNNILLYHLSCAGNTLTTLDVTNNVNLKVLDCSSNPLITNIDISNNPLLEIVDVSNAPIGTIDLSVQTDLKRFTAQFCQLTSLNLSNNLDLEYLRLDANPVGTVDVSANINLTDIRIQNNPTANPNWFTTLNLGSVLDLNNITTLHVQNNPNLTIHVGTAQRVTDFQNIFVAGTHYDVGTNIVL